MKRLACVVKIFLVLLSFVPTCTIAQGGPQAIWDFSVVRAERVMQDVQKMWEKIAPVERCFEASAEPEICRALAGIQQCARNIRQDFAVVRRVALENWPLSELSWQEQTQKFSSAVTVFEQKTRENLRVTQNLYWTLEQRKMLDYLFKVLEV